MTPAKLRDILSCMYEYITLIEQEETNRLVALEKERERREEEEEESEGGGGAARKQQQKQKKEKTDPKRTARLMTVVDVGGLSIGNLNKDTFSFMLTAGDIMDNYYPGRVMRICIVVRAPDRQTDRQAGRQADRATQRERDAQRVQSNSPPPPPPPFCVCFFLFFLAKRIATVPQEPNSNATSAA